MLLRMQNQAIDANDEDHEDIIDELEDMDDKDDSNLFLCWCDFEDLSYVFLMSDCSFFSELINLYYVNLFCSTNDFIIFLGPFLILK